MSDLTWIEIIYWGATIIGGTLFILRLIMLFVGGIDHHAFDSDLDISHAEGPEAHADADVSFKLLSLQGLTSFFMMFGLVGLALLKASVQVPLTVVGGTVAGLATVAVVSLIFAQMKRLQTEGTLDIQNTVGTQGSVYLTIPENGSGQVQVIVQGALKIFDAVSGDAASIPTGSKVHVVAVTGGNTLIVQKTNQ